MLTGSAKSRMSAVCPRACPSAATRNYRRRIRRLSDEQLGHRIGPGGSSLARRDVFAVTDTKGRENMDNKTLVLQCMKDYPKIAGGDMDLFNKYFHNDFVNHTELMHEMGAS